MLDDLHAVVCGLEATIRGLQQAAPALGRAPPVSDAMPEGASGAEFDSWLRELGEEMRPHGGLCATRVQTPCSIHCEPVLT